MGPPSWRPRSSAPSLLSLPSLAGRAWPSSPSAPDGPSPSGTGTWERWPRGPALAPIWTTPCSDSSRPMGQWFARTTPRPRSRPFPCPPRRSRGCRPLLPRAPCRTPLAWLWPPFRSRGPRPRRGPLSSPIWWSSNLGSGPQPSWLARLRRPPRAPFPRPATPARARAGGVRVPWAGSPGRPGIPLRAAPPPVRGLTAPGAVLQAPRFGGARAWAYSHSDGSPAPHPIAPQGAHTGGTGAPGPGGPDGPRCPLSRPG